MILLLSQNMLKLENSELSRLALIHPEINVAYCKYTFNDMDLCGHAVNDWGFLEPPQYLIERYKSGNLSDEVYADWYRTYLRKIWFSYGNCLYETLGKENTQVLLVYPSSKEYKVLIKTLVSFLKEHMENKIAEFSNSKDLLRGI